MADAKKVFHLKKKSKKGCKILDLDIKDLLISAMLESALASPPIVKPRIPPLSKLAKECRCPARCEE